MTAKRMTPEERHDWISKYLRENPRVYGVDVVNSAFVDAYLVATQASYRPTNFGAHKCRQLGRDLAAMERDGRLERKRISLADLGTGMGFPRWVWVYSLPEHLKPKPGP